MKVEYNHIRFETKDEAVISCVIVAIRKLWQKMCKDITSPKVSGSRDSLNEEVYFFALNSKMHAKAGNNHDPPSSTSSLFFLLFVVGWKTFPLILHDIYASY